MGLFSGNGFLSQLGNTALSFLPGVGGYMAGQEANQANAQQAQQQMGFQERMSNTAHQREVADLRAAGLNPILSANGGGVINPPRRTGPNATNRPFTGHNVSNRRLQNQGRGRLN